MDFNKRDYKHKARRNRERSRGAFEFEKNIQKRLFCSDLFGFQR